MNPRSLTRLTLAAAALSTALSAGALAQTPGSAAHQTLLVASLYRGAVRVEINGKFVGDFQSTMRLDVSNSVRPGKNTLTATATDDDRPLGSVRVAHAAKANQFRTLAELDFGVLNRKKSLSATFVLPGRKAEGTSRPAQARAPRKAETAAFRRSSDRSLPFRAELPRGWFLAPMNNGEARGIGLTNSEDVTKPRSVIQMQAVKITGPRPGMKNLLAGFERSLKGLGLTDVQLGGKRSLKCNGFDAVERLYRYRHAGQDLRSRVWLVLGDEYAYSFSLIAPPSLYERHNPVFRHVLQSLELV